MGDEKKVILEMKNISKYFPGVQALDNAQLTVKEGEVVASYGRKWRWKIHFNEMFIWNIS